jgi:UDP-N-acetylglucosamine 2-epimerase
LVKNTIKDGNKVKVTKDEDVFDLLKNAKIIYTFISSVGVEALLMKKPLIVLDYLPKRPYNYEKYGGCLVAKNYEDLELSTEKILKDVHRYLEENNENIEKTRRYFSGDSKGESYKNVAMVINEMLYE